MKDVAFHKIIKKILVLYDFKDCKCIKNDPRLRALYSNELFMKRFSSCVYDCIATKHFFKLKISYNHLKLSPENSADNEVIH